MTDDGWRPSEDDPTTAEFGGPLFADEPRDATPSDNTGERRLGLRSERHRAVAALDGAAHR